MARVTNQHPWELAAEALAEWMDTMPQKLADAILGSDKPPFAAEASIPDQLGYWHSLFFDPIGQPNPVGRAKVMALYGPDIYAQIAKELAANASKLVFAPPAVAVRPRRY